MLQYYAPITHEDLGLALLISSFQKGFVYGRVVHPSVVILPLPLCRHSAA